MAYTIKDNVPALLIKTRANANIFLRIACDVLEETANPKTPKGPSRDRSGATSAGNLRNSTLKQVIGLHGQVRWRSNYAAYQERGKRFDGSHVVRKYTTPGTGAHFAENAAKTIPHRTQEIAVRSGLL